MVVKMNNKNEKFYDYMGRVFGSRIIQLKTNDRIYDDEDKDWFIYLNDGIPVGFVSIAKNVIKNVYATKDEYLIQILSEVKKQIEISPSIVPRVYEDIYIKSGFEVINQSNYKNFVLIRGKNDE